MFVAFFQNEDDEGVVATNPIMVASVKLFLQNLTSTNGGNYGAIRAGGIGEVCTSMNHRRKGLSHRLLNIAIDYMKDHLDEFQVSVLHASTDAFRSVYAKVGYRCSRTCWTKVEYVFDGAVHSENMKDKAIYNEKGECKRTWMRSDDCKDGFSLRIRSINFPEDMSSMSKIYDEMSKENSFVGCVIRSDEYWSEYVSNEMLVAPGCLTPLVLADDKTGSLLAWVSLRDVSSSASLNPIYIVKEFGFDKRSLNLLNLSILDALKVLLEESLSSICSENLGKKRYNILLPTLIWKEIMLSKDQLCLTSSYFEKGFVHAEDDIGWMYLAIDENSEEVKTFLEIIDTPEQVSRHLIWPTDSF